MVKQRGEIWHIFKILECLDKPKNQDQIRRVVKIHHYNLNTYLKKLLILDYIDNVDPKSLSKKPNGMEIIWKIRPKGQEFKKIISNYVSLGRFDLK